MDEKKVVPFEDGSEGFEEIEENAALFEDGLEELEEAEELEEEAEEEKDAKAPVYFNDLPEDTEVIGVKFRSSGKIYYFDPKGVVYPEGSHAVVETARGQEYGTVAQSNKIVSGREIVLPLRCALRIATPEDDAHNKENLAKAEEAFLIGNKKIAEHELDMKLIDTEYTFDNSKLLFYFTSEGRVDFRDLVKDLASVFRCRIELRQMGIRDEAKVLGGLGSCGRPFCCHAFLPDFVQVSIKMAKEQNLSLNAAKISGACGRLMCCLRYEYDTYLEEGRLTPKVDSLVNTPDGIGVVVEAKPLLGLVKVKTLEDDASAPKVYAREDLTPIKKGDDNYERALEEKTLDKAARAAGTTRAALKAEKAGLGKPKKEEKPQRSVRPAPQRAASFTDQVMPSALAEKTEPLQEQEATLLQAEETVKEQGREQSRRNGRGGRGRRGGKSRQGEQTAKPERTEKGEGRGEGKPEQTEKPKSERPARYEKTSRGEKPEAGAGEKSEKAPRYEKTSGGQKNGQKPRHPANGERKPKPHPQHEEGKPAAAEKAAQASGEQSEKKKKNHRPFRHYGKKKDGGKEQKGE
ncbi:MAG: hypothetical protein IJZ33_00755 [Clostridia bacterium]|nr:hypothetical protein [Clostridia bacterium]